MELDLVTNSSATFAIIMMKMIAKPTIPGPFMIPIALKIVIRIRRTGIMVSIRYFPTKVLRMSETTVTSDPSFFTTASPNPFLPRVRPFFRSRGTMNSRIRNPRKSERAVTVIMILIRALRAPRISMSEFIASTAASYLAFVAGSRAS